MALKINDRIVEKETGAKGTVVDIDRSYNLTQVLFDDIGKGTDLWWCDNSAIKKLK